MSEYKGAATLWEAMIENNVARHRFNKALAAWLAVLICPACNNSGYKPTKRPWPAPALTLCHCEHAEGKPAWEKVIDDDIPF